jgi:hypothetical protein
MHTQSDRIRSHTLRTTDWLRLPIPTTAAAAGPWHFWSEEHEMRDVGPWLPADRLGSAIVDAMEGLDRRRDHDKGRV